MWAVGGEWLNRCLASGKRCVSSRPTQQGTSSTVFVHCWRTRCTNSWPIWQIIIDMVTAMSIERKMCKMKIFQLQSLLNATICINHRFEPRILVYLSESCLTDSSSQLDLSNPKVKSSMQKVSASLLDMTIHTAADPCSQQGDMGSIQALGTFVCHWARQWTDTLLLSLIFLCRISLVAI